MFLVHVSKMLDVLVKLTQFDHAGHGTVSSPLGRTGQCPLWSLTSPKCGDAVTGMSVDTATPPAAMQVCPPCSATCDTMFRLQGTAAWATSTKLGSFLASHPWSHLTTLVTAWGDWWALPVPLPVPLRVKVLATNTPFSLRNPLGRPAFR